MRTSPAKCYTFVVDEAFRYDNATSTTVTDIYRTFAGIHTALGPYLLSTGADAFESNSSSMTFTDDTTYLLGHDILVAPLLSNQSNSRSVHFPATGTWVSWFTNETYAGGSRAIVTSSMAQFPVFKKAGSIIAMNGEFAHHACAADAALYAAAPPALVMVVTHPVAAGMTCVRRSGSKGTGFIAEYSHDLNATTVLSARNRGAQSVAFVMVRSLCFRKRNRVVYVTQKRRLPSPTHFALACPPTLHRRRSCGRMLQEP